MAHFFGLPGLKGFEGDIVADPNSSLVFCFAACGSVERFGCKVLGWGRDHDPSARYAAWPEGPDRA